MIRNVVLKAASRLQQITLPTNSSAIFDIDDTLIRSSGELIPEVRDLYNYTLSLGMTTFIITNRVGTDENIERTHQELSSHGIVNYNTAYFRDADCHNMWYPKLNARKHISDRGYTTIISVGDKPWDIGKYGGLGVIIPL